LRVTCKSGARSSLCVHSRLSLSVMDNLNTHNIASLYETFEPKEARCLAERLDIHYTPKHGSWLNMAEQTKRTETDEW